MSKAYRFTPEEHAETSSARNLNKDKRVEKRLEALELRCENKKGKEISLKTGFNRKYITELVSKYRVGGINAITNISHKSASRNMSLENEKELLKDFEDLALKGQIVRVSEIRKKYDETIGHKSGNGQIYRVLKRNNWRKIKPRGRHPKKSNDEAIEASKKLTKN